MRATVSTMGMSHCASAKSAATARCGAQKSHTRERAAQAACKRCPHAKNSGANGTAPAPHSRAPHLCNALAPKSCTATGNARRGMLAPGNRLELSFRASFRIKYGALVKSGSADTSAGVTGSSCVMGGAGRIISAVIGIASISAVRPATTRRKAGLSTLMIGFRQGHELPKRALKNDSQHTSRKNKCEQRTGAHGPVRIPTTSP